MGGVMTSVTRGYHSIVRTIAVDLGVRESVLLMKYMSETAEVQEDSRTTSTSDDTITKMNHDLNASDHLAEIEGQASRWRGSESATRTLQSAVVATDRRSYDGSLVWILLIESRSSGSLTVRD